MSEGAPGPPGDIPARGGGPGPALAGPALAGTALAAAGLALGAAELGDWPLAAALAVLQAGFAWAWGRALRASAGTIPLIAGFAILADVAVLTSGRHAFGSAAGVAGSAVAGVVLYQLGLRRAVTLRPAEPGAATLAPVAVASVGDGSPGSAAPTRVSAELVTGLAGIIVAVLSTGYLAVRAEAGAAHPGQQTAVAGLLGVGAAVGAARLFGWARLAPPVAAVLGLVVAVGAGALLGSAGPDGLTLRAGLVAAAAGGGGGALVDLVLARVRAGRPTDAAPGLVIDMLLVATLPLACAAPLVYLVGRHLPG